MKGRTFSSLQDLCEAIKDEPRPNGIHILNHSLPQVYNKSDLDRAEADKVARAEFENVETTGKHRKKCPLCGNWTDAT